MIGFTPELFARGTTYVLSGDELKCAQSELIANHYTHSIPSGKSHYIKSGEALIVWSIPANKNLARFLLGFEGSVWELSRLWAPDGHEPNLLTQAISKAVKIIKRIENPDVLVSYADPNVGHHGGVYRAASWIHHGTSEESRSYRDSEGNVIARRAFHSGDTFKTKSEIEAMGYTEVKSQGKERFVKPLTSRAGKAIDHSTLSP